MSLVNELQVSAEKEDVLTVLRKARRLASKLGVNDIDDWLKAEQDGYDANIGREKKPPYRWVKGSLAIKADYPIPVGMGQMATGVMDFPGLESVAPDMFVPESMATLLALVDVNETKGKSLSIPVDDPARIRDLRACLPDLIRNSPVTFLIRMNMYQMRAIPDAVKDKILEWALALERRGVLGEGVTFTEKEKNEAHNITFNISHSKIEQLTNTGTNSKR